MQGITVKRVEGSIGKHGSASSHSLNHRLARLEILELVPLTSVLPPAP